MDFLEKLKKIRRIIYIKTITIVFIFIGGLILLICDSEELDKTLIIMAFLCGILFINTIIKMFVIKKDKDIYNKIYKENILLNCLKEHFTNVEYKLSEDNFHDGLLPEKFIEVAENIKIPGGIIFNDYISASYKNIKFEFVDMKMLKEIGTYNGPSSGREHTSFKGQWLVIETNKKIETNIQIFDKTFKGKKKDGLLSGKKYKETKTNDIEFDNQFNIFMERKIDISNIITPSIIQKIKRIKSNLGLKMFIYFMDNRICILLENKKDFFEPNVYKKIDIKEAKNKILNQIKDIIELLDLNN